MLFEVKQAAGAVGTALRIEADPLPPLVASPPSQPMQQPPVQQPVAASSRSAGPAARSPSQPVQAQPVQDQPVHAAVQPVPGLAQRSEPAPMPATLSSGTDRPVQRWTQRPVVRRPLLRILTPVQPD